MRFGSSRTLSLLLAPVLLGACLGPSVQPDLGPEPEGGGGSDPPAPKEPAAEGATSAPVSAPPEASTSPASADAEEQRPLCCVASFRIADEDGTPRDDLPAFTLSFNAAMARGLAQTAERVALGAAVLMPRLLADLQPRRCEAQVPQPAPREEDPADRAKKAAAAWVRSSVGPRLAEEAAKLRAEAIVDGDGSKKERADALEQRLVQFLVEAERESSNPPTGS